MQFKIGDTVELNQKSYTISGKHKRSFLLERDGKTYKCGPAKLTRVLNGEKPKRRTAKATSVVGTENMDARLKYNQIFYPELTFPTTESELMEWANKIASELSPENLSCDGELSMSAVRAKRRSLMAEVKEVEKLLGRSVDIESMY